MKKRSQSLDAQNKNMVVTAVFFLAGFAALNFIGDSLTNHILGIVFIIAGTWGVVSISKKTKFLF